MRSSCSRRSNKARSSPRVLFKLRFGVEGVGRVAVNVAGVAVKAVGVGDAAKSVGVSVVGVAVDIGICGVVVGVAVKAIGVVGAVDVDGVAAVVDAEASPEADVGCCKLSITFLLTSALFRLIGLLPVLAKSGLSSSALKVARI